jgi:hypothetical protein
MRQARFTGDIGCINRAVWPLGGSVRAEMKRGWRKSGLFCADLGDARE